MRASGLYVRDMLVLEPDSYSTVQSRPIPRGEKGTMSSSADIVEDAALRLTVRILDTGYMDTAPICLADQYPRTFFGVMGHCRQ